MASIEKRGDRSWRLVVEAGYDSKGKRVKRSKTVKIEDEALLRTTKKLNDYLKLELAKFQMEVEAGEYIAPEKMTFAAFVGEWRKKYAEKELKPKTVHNYMKCIEKRILPVFGNKRLDQIKPIHIVNFLSDLSEGERLDGREGALSASTIKLIHLVLLNVLERATEWRIIKENPSAAVKSPRAKKATHNVYDEHNLAVMLEALAAEPSQWRTMILLAIATGMRLGELIGLEWRHVDLVNGMISVQQNISLFKDGVPVITTPKTDKSIRKVSLPESAKDMLVEYLEVWKEEKESAGEFWETFEGREFVFQNSGYPYRPDSARLWFYLFLKRHELPYIRFHDLRHTSATILITHGVQAKVIAERFGHSNIQTTMNIYGHVLESVDKAAAAKLDSVLSPKKPPK